MDGNLAITRTVFFFFFPQKRCAVFRMSESNLLCLTFSHPNTCAFRGRPESQNAIRESGRACCLGPLPMALQVTSQLVFLSLSF